MAEITAALVKELREKSGAGMMDCKKALAETAGNLEDAIDWLRKKGLAAAAKKASRTAAEGLVGIVTDGTRAAVVEVNSETDFVARNESFQGFVAKVAAAAVTGKEIEALREDFAAELTTLIATIGENMNMRRSAFLSVDAGVVASYMHTQIAPGLGKIGCLVALESTGDAGRLAELGKSIAMHVAAAFPKFRSIEEVDAASLERERAVLTEQAAGSGKPAAVIEKMVEGRIRKYYEEVVLLEQVYVIDGESKIKDVVAKVAKEIGAPITLTGFARFQLGEGIEKEVTDFAAEVAAQAGR